MSEEARDRWVMEWCVRMGAQHGHTVYDVTEPTKMYDWGQALCREQYGLNWVDDVPDSPTEADVQRAREWEHGSWPDWAWTPKRNEALA